MSSDAFVQKHRPYVDPLAYVLIVIGLGAIGFTQLRVHKFNQQIDTLYEKYRTLRYTVDPQRLNKDEVEWLNWIRDQGGFHCQWFSRTVLSYQTRTRVEISETIFKPDMESEIRGNGYWIGALFLAVGLIHQLHRLARTWWWVRAGRCRNCGYILVGQTIRCPECGCPIQFGGRGAEAESD